MMTKQILFIQGAGEGAYEEDKLWTESLQDKLGARNWEFDEVVLPNGFASKFPNNLSVFCYHSRDDQWVPFDHLSLYANKLPQATIRTFDDHGHQFNNNLSEVARDIKGLMG